MKKINFLFLLILPFIGFSQTYNFDDTNDGWNNIRFFTSSNESTYMTLTTKPTNASSKNPYFGIIWTMKCLSLIWKVQGV